MLVAAVAAPPVRSGPHSRRLRGTLPEGAPGGSDRRQRPHPAPAGRRRSLAITADVADAAQVQAMVHRVVAGKPRAWRSSAASASCATRCRPRC